MNIATDEGACSYCGAVMELRLLTKVQDKQRPGVDTYACPECIASHSVRTEGGDE